MPKYRITETQPATATWTHYVEANSQEEAIEKVYSGETVNSYYTIEPDENYEITMEDIEEVDDDDWSTE